MSFVLKSLTDRNVLSPKGQFLLLILECTLNFSLCLYVVADVTA